ncbi:MAG: precorrin-6y C5,15-methyltransferase (decarboxylating) subunit CbiE [Aestuariivita sp.]|nr:precorrin-6y C5,15-methyltransferase (decarboxylating) subunit CbiE [Aestuariivita sp.]
MANDPWLTIIGLGEDGLDGLSLASRLALEKAEVIMGPSRHLALVSTKASECVEWPIPFHQGISRLLEFRGRTTVVLTSGDPFWFGAGSHIVKNLSFQEWRAFPAPSTFGWAASNLGWSLEHIAMLGLHAAPISRLRPYLTVGQRLIVLVRSGKAVHELANYLTENGFGLSLLFIMQALAGSRERIVKVKARNLGKLEIEKPVCVAIEISGTGRSLGFASGRSNDWFETDGQISKRPIRALTLSTLAPQYGEHLWDIGGGSGSISIEWLLLHQSLNATIIEVNAERAAQIQRNAQQLGVDHLNVIVGKAPVALHELILPDAVFVGGGLDQELLNWLIENVLPGTRLVINAVTLESEALLIQAQRGLGGVLMRVGISEQTPIGSRTGWKSSYPVVQWSVTL